MADAGSPNRPRGSADGWQLGSNGSLVGPSALTRDDNGGNRRREPCPSPLFNNEPDYHGPVKAFRLLLVVLYIGYLVQVGLLMIWLPWSKLWALLMVQLPQTAAWFLDSPAVRGSITAFGVLHLAMVVAELIDAGARDASTPT